MTTPKPRPPVTWLRAAAAATAAASVLATAEATAAASPIFPGVVQTHLELASAPDCTLCHAGTPGLGSATTPFATSLRSRGASAGNEASLTTALDALAGERKDSDGDGTPDIEELKAGSDPNGAGEGTITPEYGCSVGAPGRVRGDDAAMAAAAALVAACAFGLGLSRRRGHHDTLP